MLSRFGTMFFADPVVTFTNLGGAMRPGGRLLMVVWRGMGENEWLRCVLAALAVGRDLPTSPPGAPGPFGLADPASAIATLTAARFDTVELAPVDQPVWIGADGDDAFRFFSGTGIVRGMTQGLDETQRARALTALRATMIEHDTGDGVHFGSGGWLISARRPAP